MRNTISALLLCVSFGCFSQRVSFNDPDLTFSFKKPKSWQVFDDGYLVKVAPSAVDSSDVYFSITYFEDAKPLDGLGFPSDTNKQDSTGQFTKIDKIQATYFVEKNARSELKKFHFYKKGQRFEVETKHKPENKDQNHTLWKMVKSIKVISN